MFESETERKRGLGNKNAMEMISAPFFFTEK